MPPASSMSSTSCFFQCGDNPRSLKVLLLYFPARGLAAMGLVMTVFGSGLVTVFGSGVKLWQGSPGRAAGLLFFVEFRVLTIIVFVSHECGRGVDHDH